MQNEELMSKLRNSGFFLLSEPLQAGVIEMACGASRCLEMHANSKSDMKESLKKRDIDNDAQHLDSHAERVNGVHVQAIDDESGLPDLFHVTARAAIIHAWEILQHEDV